MVKRMPSPLPSANTNKSMRRISEKSGMKSLRLSAGIEAKNPENALKSLSTPRVVSSWFCESLDRAAIDNMYSIVPLMRTFMYCFTIRFLSILQE